MSEGTVGLSNDPFRCAPVYDFGVGGVDEVACKTRLPDEPNPVAGGEARVARGFHAQKKVVFDSDHEASVCRFEIDIGNRAPDEGRLRFNHEREAGDVGGGRGAGEVVLEGFAERLVLVDYVVFQKMLQVGIHFVFRADEGEYVAFSDAKRVLGVSDSAQQIRLRESSETVSCNSSTVSFNGDQVKSVRHAEEEARRMLRFFGKGALSHDFQHGFGGEGPRLCLEHATGFDARNVEVLFDPMDMLLVAEALAALGDDVLVQISDEARLYSQEERMDGLRSR